MVCDDQHKVQDEEHKEERRLVPHYEAVPGYRDEDGEVDGVNNRVPGQGEPIQFDVIE